MKNKLLSTLIVFTMMLSIFNLTIIKSEAYVTTLDDLKTMIEANTHNIILNDDIEINERIDIDDVKADIIIDLNGKTINCVDGNKGRGFKLINGKLTIKNGIINSNGTAIDLTKQGAAAGSGAYGTIGTSGGKLVLNDLTLSNGRPWGLNLLISGGSAELNNVNIDSTYGGGIQADGSVVTLTNTNIHQRKYFDHCSTAISVSGGGILNVNSSSYYSEDGYGIYVFNSGGTINTNGGTYYGKIATIKADNDGQSGTSASIVNTNAGDFTGELSIDHLSKLHINGGTFTSDPTAYIGDNVNVKVIDSKYVVYPKATNLELSLSFLSLKVNNFAKLTATLSPALTLDTLTWTTSDHNVATVDDNGTVKAIGIGTTKITASVNDIDVSCVITVVAENPIEESINGNTNMTLDDSAIKVLSQSLDAVIANVDTTTLISQATRIALKDAMAQGKAINIEPEANSLNMDQIPKDTLAKINSTLNTKEEIAQFYDLNMNLTADGTAIGTMDGLNQEIEFTLTMDESLVKEGRKFYTLRIHEGTLEKLDGYLNGNEFVFATNKFSLYALVYDDSQTKKEKDSLMMTHNKVGVDTGDHSDIVKLFVMIALSMISIATVIGKYKSNNNL